MIQKLLFVVVFSFVNIFASQSNQEKQRQVVLGKGERVVFVSLSVNGQYKEHQPLNVTSLRENSENGATVQADTDKTNKPWWVIRRENND